MNIAYQWKVVGQNCDENKSVLEAFGHNADCYKSFADGKWVCRVDMAGKTGFASEADAKEFAESEITNKIIARINTAKSDLSLFETHGLTKPKKTSGKFLSIADFESYIENNIKPALEVVGTNLRNPNKLNQVAARALGFSSYEALQPIHHREMMIKEKLYVEKCPYQQNNVCIKAANILVVIDVSASKIRFRALNIGEECETVTDENEFTFIGMSGIDLDVHISEYKFTDAGKSDLLYPQIDVVFTSDDESHALVVKRTDEGVIADVIFNYKSDCGSADTAAVAFSDADGEDYEDVNQAYASLNNPLPAADGEYYQWLEPTMTEDGLRYLKINPDEEICISELMFASPQIAIEAINSGEWAAYPEDVEDAVLVKVTKTIIGCGRTLCKPSE